MVKLMGHLGMTLVLALPAWLLWEWRVTLAFVALALSTAMLPDVDLVLADVLPIVHHGITHTVLFVGAVAVALGAVVAYRCRRWLESVLPDDRWAAVSDRSLFGFVAGGLLLGGLGHIFTDVLSAPDIAAPVTPFWPLVTKPWSIDVIWYASFRWNVGLLAAGIALHAVAATLEIAVGKTAWLSRDT